MGLLSPAASPRGHEFAPLLATIAHRGPDAHRTEEIVTPAWRAQLGHHRLSIIDLAGGTQPMRSGESTLIFNGEIYNYKKLRAAMTPREGWQTDSDTEVILEKMRAEGESCLRDFDGFFAFAVYDARREELLLARDRWGIKPLYYSHLTDGTLLFASELHPFLRWSALERQVPNQSVLEYLFRDFAPRDQTLLANVRKLEPGCGLRWRRGQIEVFRYFDPRELLEQPRVAAGPAAVWRQLQESVQSAMIADVPVGILLSGGIDSSVIAAIAARTSKHALPTFSIGFDDVEFDESEHARAMAKTIKSEHHERRISRGDMLERWEEIVTSLDEPIGDPSLIPTRFLMELARAHVPVVLGGDGGDELYGGYPTYQAHKLNTFIKAIPPFAREGLIRLTRTLPVGDGYQPFAWKLKRLLERYDPNPVRGHFQWMSGTAPKDLRLLDPSYANSSSAEGRLNHNYLQTILYLDLVNYLPYSVLTKVDRASMSVGLEARPPFLGNANVGAAFRIPIEQKVGYRETKRILRQAAAPHLPAEILGRAKRGFAIPLRRWLKGELAADVRSLLNESPVWDTLANAHARRMWAEFLDGTGDHAKTFWSLLVLHKWMNKHNLRMAT